MHQGRWQLGPGMSLGYVIRFPAPGPAPAPGRDHGIQVDDVFVSLAEVLTLLTNNKTKPPNLRTVWTINIGAGDAEDADYCPITDFIYHAALKSTGKKFRGVFHGIVSSIVSGLYRAQSGEEQPELIKYKEIARNTSTEDHCDPVKSDEQGDIKYEAKEYGEPTDWDPMSPSMEDMLEQGVKEEANDDYEWMGHLEGGFKRKSKHEDSDYTEYKEKKIRKSLKEDPDSDNEDGDANYQHWNQANVAGMKPKKKRKKKYEDGSYPCDKCDKVYNSRGALYNHNLNAHMSEHDRAEMKDSKDQAARLGNLDVIHERTPIRFEDKELWPCSLALCGLKFDRLLAVVAHERTHVEAYICVLCGECCHSAELLIIHSDTQHPAKSRFVCRVCGFFTRNNPALKTHMQQVHMQGSQMFQCDECEYTTEKIQTLRSHKRAAHSNSEFFCDICGKNYASKQSLYVHKKSHEEDFKKFQCQLCPRAFAYSSGLAYHMNVHTGEKPFACNQCDARFGSGSALNRHVKVVHAKEEDMVYQCEHCGQKFPARKKQLYTDHLKQHTGVRDHICSVCGNGYYSRKILRKHERKNHPHLIKKREEIVRIDPDSVPKITVTQRATMTFHGVEGYLPLQRS